MTFGAQTNTEEGVVEIMQAALNAGINFFDCAEYYSQGESEVLTGKAIKQLKWKRSEYVISTKIFWGGKVSFCCVYFINMVYL